MNDKLKNAVMNVPELRFPEFSEDWVLWCFGDFTKINQGLQIPISERLLKQIKGSYFYITNEFLKEGSLNKYFVLNPSLSVLCKDDDVLMTRTGNTGQVVTGVTGVFHNNFFKIRFDRDIANKDFLVYFLRLYKTQCQILRLAGTSTIPDLNHSDFYRLRILLPIINEQQKIANFLKQVDKRIEKLEKKKEKLEQYKKGIMQKLFSQQIRFKDEDGNDYPAWEDKKLGTIAKFTKGKNISKADIDMNGEIPCIRYGELYTEYGEIIDEVKSKTNIDSKNLVFSEANDVIIPASGETQLDIATASCVMSNGIALGGDLNIIKSPLNGIFLSYYLNSVKKNDIASLAQGNAVVHLYGKELKTLKINVPIINEQEKIADFLSAIDKQIEKTVSQIDSSKTFKKGLLQKMFV